MNSSLTPIHLSMPKYDGNNNIGRSAYRVRFADTLNHSPIASIYKLPVDPSTPDTIIYSCLEKYVMTPEKIEMYGYPLPHPTEEGRAIIPTGLYPTTVNYFNSNQRTCSRCKTIFQVKEDGTPIVKHRCFYHKGLLKRHPFLGFQIYSCCRQVISSLGCKYSDAHVVDGSGHPDYDRGFIRTQKKDLPEGSCPGIFALDCEMCNTSIGIEVTKVTVVDSKFQVVYETLVKPKNPILDYNTQFSGLKEGDLDHVTVSLEEVQEKLLELFNDRTILIGHALRNDLKVLKILHLKVIDTEEVFPDSRGLPFTQSLKRIVQETFNTHIQMFDHDSKQDAIACMNLMLRKVIDELKQFLPKEEMDNKSP